MTGAPGEWMARGKQARSAVPRSAHAAFDASTLDRDPIAVLEQQAETRVAELIPLRYGRMLASPSAFYRGGALVMACDLARTPTTGISVQVSGDAHLNNFGLFASPERRLVFDVNDEDGRSLQPDRRALIEQFRVVDIARKVVGVGSVGTRTWVILLLGRDDQDPLFLQAKEAQPSVLEAFVGKSEHVNHGQRVVTGQRLMQATSDIFLGWEQADVDGQARDFYVRQLRDGKGSVVVQMLTEQGLSRYGELCGWTLARAHARSGDRFAIAGYLGTGDSFDRALAEFAEAYADQNERDYQALADAVASGRVTAQTGL